MLSLSSGDAVGGRLDDVLALTDTEGRDWCRENQPYRGLSTRSGVPEQAWLLPDGTEVLTTARISRGGRGGPVEQVAVVLRSGRGDVGALGRAQRRVQAGLDPPRDGLLGQDEHVHGQGVGRDHVLLLPGNVPVEAGRGADAPVHPPCCCPD